MRKKIISVLILGLVALMMFSVVAPVFAANPNKVSVTAKDLTTGGASYDPSTYRWVTDGNISHVVYMRLWGTLNIYLGEEVIPVSWVDELSGVYNMKTKEGVWKWYEVWTLPGGTFEGTAHVKIVGGSLTTYKEFYSHIVLHGTGDYEGQVLSLDMDRPDRSQPGIYEGFWLKP